VSISGAEACGLIVYFSSSVEDAIAAVWVQGELGVGNCRALGGAAEVLLEPLDFLRC
jgi:hypothetical protein